MKIAYILNTYPQPSHSFIRREVQALERQGVLVLRLAMRSSDMPLVDPGDKEEAARTTYVLKLGAARLLFGLLAEATHAPRCIWRAVWLALKLARGSDRGVLRHLVYLAEAAQVKRRCFAEGVDHMHAHFGTNATAVVMLVQAMGGPGYSFTTHGPEEFDAPSALSLGEKVNRAAFSVAISSFGRSQLSRWARFGHWDRIKVVHCGIEPARFENPVAVPEGSLRLVSIGRFVEQKGQMILVQAMADLVKDLPDIHLSLIGDGEMRADLEAAISARGLQNNITLTGWLSEADVKTELAAAHALVLPSFAEGLPMVVMEAMAAARPVITTFVAGTPELVLPGKTGWLVPAGDYGAVVDAVKQLAATPHDAVVKMGQAGRDRVLQRHDSEQEAAKLAALFQKAVAENRR
ncbi:colanic acid biosynthesis glycosyltransferase WcaL (plasmid) [Parasedimentitalea marina]|uniref:Colanic acid biosynthesis glycosyltransferase WcaL n=1 Tax=Parasedimentitalea marina TaxID=2483033 RepID=A0A3T0NAG5_9RHOB|nr:glycosyltransferase [Parasedimentitalea marina]AZV80993.1 colanic acid biosynthesis glycosyltransferase WcaL [Parasedimentitalea marina]